MNPRVKRKSKKLQGDPKRVIARPYHPGNAERVKRVIHRVLRMSDVEAEHQLEQIMLDFGGRHRDIETLFSQHLAIMEEYLPENMHVNETRKKLIGACFTMEYSVESAALFNPSIVPHPDQEHLPPGAVRFIISLRATGEGHISSIVFRSGVINADNLLAFDPISDFVETPSLHRDSHYDRHLLELKLNEIGACSETSTWVLDQLPDTFTYSALTRVLDEVREKEHSLSLAQTEALETMDWLANSNYEITFRAEYPLSERVIFPVSKNESGGIEDARFVRFVEDDGEVTYYATYTAYNGFSVLPQLIETKDFITFNVITLNGRAVHNKGMALFPHKIGGKYVMLSRQDGENNQIMFSDHLHFWQESKIIQQPERPWEIIQVGNCGSPLETKSGWLVLTHGVGPMREYSIGAMLLDLDDPTRIIARLEDPLITPHEQEREGYVPNVVYTCGSIIHGQDLIIPFAMSDVYSGIATVNVDELLSCMQRME